MNRRAVYSFLRAVAVFSAMLAGTVASAQGFTVKLKLVDSKSSGPVQFATASLTPKGSSSVSNYALSDSNGLVSLEKVKKGTYLLKAELLGYKAWSQEINVSKEINLGEIRMEEDVEVLNAASVSAVGNPIVVKKDTIEYNASSFKTSDNDMLEELLKKLPGVEVGTDGTITANGETITKITIDGKTFFLDDPQLASKNIPAKLIEKVKVVEKKSDQAMFTGIDDGEEETVIDLSMRPGMMQGWFGNMQAGGGHDLQHSWSDGDWRYQGAAMIGRFTDKSQLSIILNGNNTNNRGFNDMAGSMMQGMRGSGRGMGRGNGGWGRNNGITTSWMGGVNGAWTLFDGDMDLGGNYLYSGSQKSLLEKSDKITYLDNGDLLIYNNGGPESYGRNSGYGFSDTRTQGHRFGVRLEHKFSENTSVIFEPQVNFGSGSYNEYSDFTTSRYRSEQGDTLKTNDGFSSTLGNNRNWSTSGFLLFRQRLGKPGRTLSANVRYNFSGNRLDDALNQSLTRNYEEDGTSIEDKVNQRVKSLSNTQSINARLSYTEPLGHDLYLEASYNYGWTRSHSDKDAFDSGKTDSFIAGWGGYGRENEQFDPTYSSEITNVSQNHNAGLNLQYQKGKLRAQVGASLQPTVTHNSTESSARQIDTTYTVWNWAPQAMFSYEFTDNSELRFFYRGRSAQPSTSQLMPVPDNSDPLDISFGNPYLKPYFNHSLRGHFGYTDKKSFFSIRGRFGAGLVQNPITTAVWYGDNGGQYGMPINGPASGNASVDFFLNSPIAKSNFSIMNFFRTNFSQSSSYIGRTDEGHRLDIGKYYDSETAVFDYALFNRDFFENGSTNDEFDKYFSTNIIQNVTFTERLSVKFTCDIVELNVGGRTTYNKSWYTVQASQKARWNNQVSASMNWTIPGGITLASDINYNWYRGYVTPQEDEYVWNAELSKLLFQNRFTLALKAYDILNQAKNLSITDASNYHQEVRNNTLGRYVILSLTYRFGNFGKGRGGRMGGGPGGHGGPMGPPPGR